MKVPNAEGAVIAPEKPRDYLLDPLHRRGGSKARLLISFGYRRDEWQRLEADLREQHLSQKVERVIETAYGTRYEIRAAVTTPAARSLVLRSIWQIDTGTELPRQITMHPD